VSSSNARPGTVASAGERALLSRIRDRVPPAPDWVLAGIGDDAAVVEPERNALDVVTTDALVEGVHFDRAFVPARAIGHRALVASLSDLAAMGARPRAVLLSLALPDALPLADFDRMLEGLLEAAATYRTALVGGNIARSPGPLVVDLTAIGSVQRRRIMRRSGARPGDVLYVSGEIGAAAAGLEWCRANPGEAVAGTNTGAAGVHRRCPEPSTAGEAILDDRAPGRAAAERFLYPEPRMRLGWMLGRNRAATSCVDLSDGLADAVHQLADASGLGAIVEARHLPIGAETRAWFERDGRDGVLAAIAGGEDYELLFTVPARRGRLLAALTCRAAGLALTRIGVMTRDRQVILRREGGDESLPEGFAHFR
jgi:thiamine-monophosphate kinase